MIENEDDLKRRLAEAQKKRGYLLPHHGLLALASPELLAAYDRAYTVLALEPRVLSVHDREFVWLAILIATDEALATHHIPKRAGAAMRRSRRSWRWPPWRSACAPIASSGSIGMPICRLST